MNWLRDALEWFDGREDDGDMVVLVALGAVAVAWCVGWI